MLLRAEGGGLDIGTLSGRASVITGGARGLGFAIAELFAEQGADVAILDLDGHGAEVAAQRLGGGACALWEFRPTSKTQRTSRELSAGSLPS